MIENNFEEMSVFEDDTNTWSLDEHDQVITENISLDDIHNNSLTKYLTGALYREDIKDKDCSEHADSDLENVEFLKNDDLAHT